MLRQRAAVVALLGAVLLAVGAQGSSATSAVRNGRIAYAYLGNRHFQIYTITPNGTRRRQLTSSKKFSNYDPSYSPNGKRLAFVHAFKESDIWLMDANGGRQQPLTRTQTIDEIAPAWSPDGKEIAFAVEKPASLAGIWVIGRDGLHRRQVASGPDTAPAWSPDGSEIAFQRHDASAQTDSIFVVSVTGGAPTDLSTEPGASDLTPAWSPNGSRILFSSDRGNQYELDLWVMNADGSGAKRVTHTSSRDEHSPAWSPNGNRIVYSSVGSFHGASSEQLYVARANGAAPRKITHSCGGCAYANLEPSWQPLP